MAYVGPPAMADTISVCTCGWARSQPRTWRFQAAQCERAGWGRAAEIVVELFGVPADAEVKLDGRNVSGTLLHLVRGSGEHQIEVSAKGREAFSIVHDADRDGRYAISLAPLPAPPKSAKPSRAQRPAIKGGLLRRPDF